jgi:hypothetical protein
MVDDGPQREIHHRDRGIALGRLIGYDPKISQHRRNAAIDGEESAVTPKPGLGIIATGLLEAMTLMSSAPTVPVTVTLAPEAPPISTGLVANTWLSGWYGLGKIWVTRPVGPMSSTVT